MKRFSNYYHIKKKEYELPNDIIFNHFYVDNVYSALNININNTPSFYNDPNYYIFKDYLGFYMQKVLNQYFFKKNIMFEYKITYLNIKFTLVNIKLQSEDIIYLLNVLFNIEFNDNLLVEYKKYLSQKLSNPYYLSCKKIVDNLYFKSSIKNFTYPYIDKVDKDTFIRFENFKKDFLNIRNITLNYASNENDNEIDSMIKSIGKEFLSLKNNFHFQCRYNYNEEYSSVAKNISKDNFDIKDSFLSYAIKFPKNEIFLNKYGQNIYAYTYLLNHIFFTQNSSFSHIINENNAEFIKSKFYYNEYDSYLSLFFKCDKSEELILFLNEYCNNLKTSISPTIFKQEKISIFLHLYNNLLIPFNIVNSFSYPLNNYIDYTKFIHLIEKAKYKNFIDFLDELSFLPKTAYIIEGEKGDLEK